MFRTIALHKAAYFLVPGFATAFLVNPGANFLPSFDWGVGVQEPSHLDRPVERHPGHHFGIREMLTSPTGFPNAFVRLLPDFFQMLHQVANHGKRWLRILSHTAHGVMEGSQHFAI